MYKTLLKKIAVQLNKFDIPYMIIGGQAVLYYGEPRFTKDIDVTLGIGVDAIDKIILVITKLKLAIKVKNYKKFVEQTMVMPCIDKKSGIEVDFIFSLSDYEKKAIQKAKKIKIDNTIVNIASLEDVIVHKIIAGRPRDIEDIKTMLIKNPKFDIKYINRWLKEFDIALNKNYEKIFKEIVKQL